jgi:DNA-binding XRE family transcriptional regulator
MSDRKRIGISKKALSRIETHRKTTGGGRRGARGESRSAQVAEFIKELTELRVAQGLGPTELADRSGVGYFTINKLEKENTSPRVDTLERIADALGMELRLKLVKKKGKR